MDSKLLRFFVTAIDEGSIQAAARKLNMAQPALTRRIHALEGMLGCTLLIRTVKGVAPTPVGRVLYDDARGIIDSLYTATQRARRLALEGQSEIRFGLVQSARKYDFVRSALSAFSSEQPAVGVALLRGYSRELVAALRERRLDASLLYEQRVGGASLDERLIHKERYVMAANPDHPLATAGPISLSELTGQPIVWMSRRDSIDQEDPLLYACRRHGFEPSISQWAASSEEVVDLVTIGGGICITPASSMCSVAGGRLVYRSIPGFDLELDLTLGWNRIETSPSSTFLARLHAAIDAHQDTLRGASADWTRLDGMALYRIVDQ